VVVVVAATPEHGWLCHQRDTLRCTVAKNGSSRINAGWLCNEPGDVTFRSTGTCGRKPSQMEEKNVKASIELDMTDIALAILVIVQALMH